MTRTTLDRELQGLKDELALMGSVVSRTLGDAAAILRRRDVEAAKKLMEADGAIDARQYALEDKVLVLIARQQPMATDLRTLAAIMEIASDLERIADYAKGIAKVTILMEPETDVPDVPEITAMAAKAQDMLYRAIDAFLRQDIPTARAIPLEDGQVDDLFNRVNTMAMNMTIENPSRMELANFITWAAHNLERSADRVTNICERAVFTVTGDMQELDSD